MSPWKRPLLRVYKTLQAIGAQLTFGFPGRKLRIIGVTGTDGKTTTVHLIVRALESAGYTVGAVSTIQFQVGTKRWANASKLTTPGPLMLQALLAHMVRAGCHYAVIECSSHRLDQGGLWGIPVDVAVITNISREHFDYHRDFSDYAAAKRRLFRLLRHPAKVLPFRPGMDPGGRLPTVAVANLEDERTTRMLEEPAERKYGFTQGPGSGLRRRGVTVVSAQRIPDSLSPRSIPRAATHVVRAGEQEALLGLKLPGAFNLQNVLAAIAVGVSQGIELARVTKELSEVERIPGRMDVVEAGQPFTVIIDYAVTPAAFEALYATIGHEPWAMRGQRAGGRRPRIIHVFGAAGERDRGKRPLLAAIAARHADLVILTDEDPYGENPEQILDDLAAGIPARSESSGIARETTERIRDRRLAIRAALRHARPGDSVLVTGKGSEGTMAVGRQRLPWNDRRVIEEEVRALPPG